MESRIRSNRSRLWAASNIIMCCELHNARFTYLSACHTTVDNEASPDEVVHLAAAMQFAGFRSVIGTMWAVDDGHANEITSRFYRCMLTSGSRPRGAGVAQGNEQSWFERDTFRSTNLVHTSRCLIMSAFRCVRSCTLDVICTRYSYSRASLQL